MNIVQEADLDLHRGQSYADFKARGFIARAGLNPYRISIPVDWNVDPYGDRNWQSKLLQLRISDPILVEYFKTTDKRYLREAFDWLIDWHRYHIAEGRETPASWKDSGTGWRAMRIALYLERLDSLDATEREIAALRALAEEHLRRLMNEKFIAMTNHGLFQVFGLNLLGRVTGNKEACYFARRMFEKLLSRQFDENGVHLEHSPAYHFLATKLIQRLGVQRHFRSKKIMSLLKKAEQVKSWLVFPTGREAWTGDSAAEKREVPKPEGPICTLNDGRKFLVGDLTKSGYAAIRSCDDESMIFVTGQANSRTHKHIDDLSFELFEFGRMIFVDSGKYGYNLDENRAYFVSAAAHNTVSLSDTNISLKNISKTGSNLHGIEVADNAFIISGEVERSGLFTQCRRIVYNPGRFLIIRDTLSSEDKWRFVSSLHFAPDLHPTVTGSSFALKIKGGTIHGRLMSADVPTLQSVRGQNDPLLGWSSPRYGKMEPLTVIRAVSQPVGTCEMVWVITLDERYQDEALSLAAETPLSHPPVG